MEYRYKRIYLTSTATIVSLFTILFAIGLQIEDQSGDFECNGTLEDPCRSYLTIKNPTIKNIYVYNKEEVRTDFSPNIRDYAFFVKDGRCSGKLTSSSCSCYLQNGTQIAFKGWRCVDFTNRTKPRQDRKYVFKWHPYSSREHMLVGYKEKPEDNIKWTLGVPSENAELDPIWLGVEGFNYTIRQGEWRNITTTELKNVNGDRYIEMTVREQLFDNGHIYIDNHNYSIEGYYCDFKNESFWIECDSKQDGDGNGVCQRTGGETCIVYSVGADNETIETEFNFARLEPNKADGLGVIKYE